MQRMLGLCAAIALCLFAAPPASAQVWCGNYWCPAGFLLPWEREVPGLRSGAKPKHRGPMPDGLHRVGKYMH